MTLARCMLTVLLIVVLCVACQPASIPPVATSSLATEAIPRDSGGGQTPAAEARQGGVGAVRGQVERYDGTPLKGIIIYAALIDQSGDTSLASVDALVDPHVDTDAQGRFEIANLRAGEYALATQSPVGIVLPHDKDGKTVTFRVEANQETNVGKIAVGYQYPDGQ